MAVRSDGGRCRVHEIAAGPARFNRARNSRRYRDEDGTRSGCVWVGVGAEIRLRLWDRGLCGRRGGFDDKYVRLCVADVR